MTRKPRNNQPSEEEEKAGAPDWMVTFSDCMTLLLTFFVLLLSFSSFNPKTMNRMNSIFKESFPKPGDVTNKASPSVTNPAIRRRTPEHGSTVRTPQATKDASRKKTPIENFRDRRVYIVDSDKIFWGRGRVISNQGREFLSTLANFLEKMTGTVVISETGVQQNKNIGLSRSMAVLEFLTDSKNLNPDRFNITQSSTLNKSLAESYENSGGTYNNKRRLEIALLEAKVCR